MTTAAHLDPAHKHDAVLIFDVTDGNPNGDPDNAGAPRTDIETNQGLMTDVSLKRKIRDTVPLIVPDEPGYDIYVEAGTALEAQHRRGYTALQLPLPKAKDAKDDQQTAATDEDTKPGRGVKSAPAEAKGAGKQKKQNETAVRDWMVTTFFDVRMFGAVMASQIAPAGKNKGPVQLSFARSIDPVVTIPHAITRVTQTRQSDADAGQSTEMGTKWTIPYGLYRCTVNYSAPLAARTGVTTRDLEVFWRAVELMFEHDRAATRGVMSLRGAYIFTHDDGLGRAPLHALNELITVERNEQAKPARAFTDYTVTVRAHDVPTGVTLTRLIG